MYVKTLCKLVYGRDDISRQTKYQAIMLTISETNVTW